MGIFERGEEKLPASGGSVMDFVSPLSNVDAVFELYVGQARTMTLKKPISDGKSVGVVAVGDPTVADFEVLPNPRMLRLLGKRAGLTDLSVVLGDDTILTFQVLVKHDLDLLKAEIQQRFPDASVRVSQLRENILLEGQVRSAVVAAQIEAIAESWLSRNGNWIKMRGNKKPSRIDPRVVALRPRVIRDWAISRRVILRCPTAERREAVMEMLDLRLEIVRRPHPKVVRGALSICFTYPACSRSCYKSAWRS